MADQEAIYHIKLKDSFSKGLGKIDKRVDKFEKNTLSANKKVGTSFAGLGSKLAGLGLAAGAGILIKNVAKLGIEMEQTKVSFTTFLGSAEKADKAIASLNKFSNVTPFDNAQVIKAGKGLLAFGVSQKKLIPSLKKIGDISAATGKDFNELATIYGKARIAGTLYAEDINQLVEAGVPIMGEFAKALGTTEDQVKKMASQGKLKFKDLEKAFTNLTSEGGMFFNLMAKQSETVGGKISTLTGKMQGLGITIGTELIKPLGPFLDMVIKQFDTVAERVDKLNGSVKTDINSFVDLRNEYIALNKEFATLGDDPKSLKRIGELNKQIAELGLSGTKFKDGKIIGIDFERATESLQKQERAIKQSVASSIDDLRGQNERLRKEIKETEIKEAAARGNSITDALGVSRPKEALELNQKLIELNKQKVKIGNDIIANENTLNKITRLGVTQKITDAKKLSGEDGETVTTTKTPTATASGVSSGISGGGPKNVILNIDKLVETINFNKQNLEKSTAEMTDAVKRALLTALNDAAIVQG